VLEHDGLRKCFSALCPFCHNHVYSPRHAMTDCSLDKVTAPHRARLLEISTAVMAIVNQFPQETGDCFTWITSTHAWLSSEQATTLQHGLASFVRMVFHYNDLHRLDPDRNPTPPPPPPPLPSPPCPASSVKCWKPSLHPGTPDSRLDNSSVKCWKPLLHPGTPDSLLDNDQSERYLTDFVTLFRQRMGLG